MSSRRTPRAVPDDLDPVSLGLYISRIEADARRLRAEAARDAVVILGATLRRVANSAARRLRLAIRHFSATVVSARKTPHNSTP